MCLQKSESARSSPYRRSKRLRAQLRCPLRSARRRFELPLEPANPFLELLVLDGQLVVTHRQMAIVPPPVESDLFGLVDGAHHQSNPDGEQLDFGDRNLDIAGDDQALVEDAIEDVDQAACTRMTDLNGIVRHRGVC